MHRLLRALWLVAGIVPLGACYDFGAPLDSAPTQALDSELLGTWRCLGTDPSPDAEPANIVVTAAGERVYFIRLEAEGEAPDLYEAYASDIKGHVVLNVRDLDPRAATKPWTFARYGFLLPDVLRIQLVNDDELKGVEPTSVALRAALEQRDARAEVYADFCVCVRTGSRSRDTVQ
jgi:hypothetical protein